MICCALNACILLYDAFIILFIMTLFNKNVMLKKKKHSIKEIRKSLVSWSWTPARHSTQLRPAKLLEEEFQFIDQVTMLSAEEE